MTEKLISEAATAKALGRLRRAAHLRQSDLAALLHVSTATIADREQARRQITVDTLIATAKRLGYDVALIPRQPKEQP